MSDLRQTVLLASKRFKSSWVEMGKLLVQVLDASAYKEWGYDTFDAYCYRELRLKKATVDKLTRSYRVGVPLYLVATVGAFVHPAITVAICTSLWVYWIATSKRT